MTKMKLLLIMMMILEARLSEGVTAKELFPDKLDAMMLNGVWVRKGTIAATIKNIERFNLSTDEREKAEIANGLKQLVPSLNALEIFDYYPLSYWMNHKDKDGDLSSGHRLLGALYSEFLKSETGIQVIDSAFAGGLHDPVDEKKPSALSVKPEDMLPDSVDETELCRNGESLKVRKGTVGAFLVNIKHLSQLLSQYEGNADQVVALRDEIKKQFKALEMIGFFDVFSRDINELKDSPYFNGFKDVFS